MPLEREVVLGGRAQLGAEDVAKVAEHLGRRPVEEEGARHRCLAAAGEQRLDRRHLAPVQPARHDAAPVLHLCADVEREAMVGEPARDLDAERARLGAADPHARSARLALPFEPERAERADGNLGRGEGCSSRFHVPPAAARASLFERAHVPMDVLLVVPQVEQRVHHELARAVVCHLRGAAR